MPPWKFITYFSKIKKGDVKINKKIKLNFGFKDSEINEYECSECSKKTVCFFSKKPDDPEIEHLLLKLFNELIIRVKSELKKRL